MKLFDWLNKDEFKNAFTVVLLRSCFDHCSRCFQVNWKFILVLFFQVLSQRFELVCWLGSCLYCSWRQNTIETMMKCLNNLFYQPRNCSHHSRCFDMYILCIELLSWVRVPLEGDIANCDMNNNEIDKKKLLFIVEVEFLKDNNKHSRFTNQFYTNSSVFGSLNFRFPGDKAIFDFYIVVSSAKSSFLSSSDFGCFESNQHDLWP